MNRMKSLAARLAEPARMLQGLKEAEDIEEAAETLVRAANCIEVMGREAAEDHYAVLSVAERFRVKHPSRAIWVNENWRDFVPEAYRDLIKG